VYWIELASLAPEDRAIYGFPVVSQKSGDSMFIDTALLHVMRFNPPALGSPTERIAPPFEALRYFPPSTPTTTPGLMVSDAPLPEKVVSPPR
jgi:hypothetical protein